MASHHEENLKLSARARIFHRLCRATCAHTIRCTRPAVRFARNPASIALKGMRRQFQLLLQFSEQFSDFLGAGENFAALDGIWLSGKARLEFRDFVFELALLQGAEAAFGLLPSAFRRRFKKNFE